MADRAEPEDLQGKVANATAVRAQVFISYASQDKAVADAVVNALERAGPTGGEGSSGPRPARTG